jgi:hypothetical protein
MTRYITLVAALLLLSATGLATMWTYDDPMFFQIGSIPSANFQPADISILEIVDAPYFPLLGQSFYSDAIPLKLTNSTNTVQIGSKGPGPLSPAPVTFGEHLEGNLRYAQSHSSIRIGSQGSWSALNTQGLI